LKSALGGGNSNGENMGNRSTFVLALKGIVHLLIIISLSLTSFTGSFHSLSFTKAHADEEPLSAKAIETLNRISDPTRVITIDPELVEDVKGLGQFKNVKIAQVVLRKLISEVNSLPENIDTEAPVIKMKMLFIGSAVAVLIPYFKALNYDKVFVDQYPSIEAAAQRIAKNKYFETIYQKDSQIVMNTFMEKMDQKLVRVGTPQADSEKPAPKTRVDLPREAADMLDALETLKPILQPSTLESLKRYNEPRLAEIAIWRMKKEFEAEKLNIQLIDGLTHLLMGLMSNKDLDKDVFRANEDVLKSIQEIYEQKLKGTNSVVKPAIEQMFRRAAIYNKSHYDLDEKKSKLSLKSSPGTSLMMPASDKFLSPEAELKKFKDFLDKRIIEQQEVKDVLYDLEFETLIKGKGNTSEPPLFYLMGLPGVGKDTSAEAYIEAIYGGGKAAKEHMFHVPLQRSKADAWTLLGSATGYVGSAELSPFVKFLVKHSGGRYQIVEGKGGSESGDYVIENENWKPGIPLEGYYEPERAVVFLNEFHNWSAEAKAVVMKESLEKGTFKINNPGKGIATLHVPGIRFIAASNEGIELYTNRDIDGARFGEPLTYEEMMERYNKVAHNKDLLRQTIAKTASKNPPGTPKDEKIGTPEEILNRIHPSRMILMKPISPEGLKRIVKLRIEKVNEQLFDATRGSFGSFEIEVTDKLVEFVQSYEYNPEDGARPIGDKVRSLMEYTFYQALKEAQLKPYDLKNGVTLDVKLNADKTSSLILLKGTKNATEVLKEQLIRETIKERDSNPISDEKIDKLLTLEERMKERISGAEKAIEQVSKAMLLSEEARYVQNKKWSEHEKAASFAFLGPSSTGKSEMVKALVAELHPGTGDQRRIDIDGNQIKGQHHMEEFIWGRKDGRNAVPSKFMQAYDQYNGEIVVVLEESSNIPKELLKSLYDLFREAHPKFADGKDRPMTNVTIILTGNAGIEWYSGVPRDLPEHVRMAAWQRIYKEAMKEPGKSRITLEKYYPEPLVNRIGEQNIIWFSPLSFKSVRELTVMKMNSYISKLQTSNGRRGWDVGFKSQADFERVVEIFEKEGFLLEEQGASIDRYSDMAFNKELRALLLSNKVETGAKIALAPRVDQTEEVIKKNGKVLIDVIIEGRSERLALALHAKKRESFPRDNKADLIQTAIHETGHEFVGRLLLGDKHKSDFITVIPGVAEINGEWIYYAGLRSAEQVERMVYTIEAVERSIERIFAGEVAQTIVSKGQRHDAGKSNDIERATMIARRAVGEWGLSTVWGNRSMSKQEMDSMSDADRDVFNKEVNKILNRSRNLAYNTILKNREVFSELAAELIQKGEIKSQGLEDFYSRNNSKLVAINDQERDSTKVEARLLPTGFADPNYKKTHNVEVADFFKVPSTIANIDDIVSSERNAELQKAKMPKKLPIFDSFNDVSPKPVMVLAPNKVEAQIKPEVRAEAPMSKARDAVPKQAPKATASGGTCSSLFR